MKFEDKVALVTGGSTGIGEAISRKLSENGARVVVAQRHNTHTSHAQYMEADFTRKDAAESLINRIADRYGRLDILVNNAGTMQESLLEDMDLDSWENILQVNLTTPFQLIKYALPHLRLSKGNIVNIGSIEGLGSNPAHGAYCASKAGLHGLTRAVAVDHGHEGIRCNAVAPGWIDTSLNEEFIESMADPASFRKNISKIHPLGKTGSPMEVANLVCWLASDEAGFVTGQVYTIDGGRMAQLSLPS
jgi:meso-butanediol dehydrogenase/(S,S)-butanediol dehydrogenase/diacetyl reductase